MIETPVVVKHEEALDGRPIALLVQEASQYASKIYPGEWKENQCKEYYGDDEFKPYRRREAYGCNRRGR